MSLAEYRRKRDFAATSEPATSRGSVGSRTFVIQKHEATRLHYDFRIELGGALKSWAVPRGMPFRHGEKRLAVRVEDHPVAYASFEGPIPQGEYGGGTVLLWDTGTWQPLTRAPVRDLAAGKLSFILHGTRLTGEWHLVRLPEAADQWLVIRSGPDHPVVSKSDDDRSVRTGRTMAELAAAAAPPARRRTRRAPSRAVLDFVPPMMALPVDSAPRGDNWLYEIKLDGYRALALLGAGGVRLLSRNGNDLGSQFPDIADAITRLPVDNAILDGEIVALDDEGRPSFQLLQSLETGADSAPVFYYVFDTLRLDGEDLRSQPLEVRKARVAALLAAAPEGIRFSESLGRNATPLLAQARALGLEGLIGKRAGSRYESGRRSGAWVKLKFLHEQEFVIGGMTPPEGARAHFGALLVGVQTPAGLACVGRVGTGFSAAQLASLHRRLEPMTQPECPFIDLPQPRSSPYGQVLTPTVMRRCRWVQPTLVCQVRFAEWTRDHHLRHPVYLGIRPDKDARTVVREPTLR